MAAGAPSRGVLRHLGAVVGAVKTGGVQVPIKQSLSQLLSKDALENKTLPAKHSMFISVKAVHGNHDAPTL